MGNKLLDVTYHMFMHETHTNISKEANIACICIPAGYTISSTRFRVMLAFHPFEQ
jgi:hypothetical protein